MAEVAELLQQVINLIEKDVTEIRIISLEGKLPHTVAADLVKYSGALLDLNSTIDAKRKEEKRIVEKLSIEELMRQAKEIVEGKV